MNLNSKHASAWPLIFILSVGIILLFGTLDSGHHWGGDFIQYIEQAVSILEGDPERIIEETEWIYANSSNVIGPTAYPWGLPVLYAPIISLFGLDMILLKMVGAFAFVLFGLTLWFGFRKMHSTPALACLLGLFAFNPNFLAYTNELSADIPFQLLSTLSVLLLVTLIIRGQILVHPVWDFVLLGILLAFASFTRTNGILLVGSLALFQCLGYLGRRWGNVSRITAFLALFRTSGQRRPVWITYLVFVLCFAGWRLWLPEGGNSHLALLPSLSLEFYLKQCIYYFKVPHEFFAGIPFDKPIYLATLPFAFVGILKRYKTDAFILLYCAVTLALYLSWPYTHGFRFLFPVFPFYFSFFLTGLECAAKTPRWSKMFPRPWIPMLPVYLVILLLGTKSVANVRENLERARYAEIGPYNQESSEMFDFIREKVPDDAVVVFWKPRVMYYKTGKRSVLIDNPADLSQWDYLCLYVRDGGSYGQVNPDYVQNELLEGGKVKRIFENADFQLFEL